jgi:hypothetical protein
MAPVALDPNALDPPAAFAAMRTVETWACPDLSGVRPQTYA